jgi:hypothetical protein
VRIIQRLRRLFSGKPRPPRDPNHQTPAQRFLLGYDYRDAQRPNEPERPEVEQSDDQGDGDKGGARALIPLGLVLAAVAVVLGIHASSAPVHRAPTTRPIPTSQPASSPPPDCHAPGDCGYADNGSNGDH